MRAAFHFHLHASQLTYGTADDGTSRMVSIASLLFREKVSDAMCLDLIWTLCPNLYAPTR